ncbi:MAG: hypothetical protein ABI355_17695, partial [Solirubrobacteraceae bacterium]
MHIFILQSMTSRPDARLRSRSIGRDRGPDISSRSGIATNPWAPIKTADPKGSRPRILYANLSSERHRPEHSRCTRLVRSNTSEESERARRLDSA